MSETESRPTSPDGEPEDPGSDPRQTLPRRILRFLALSFRKANADRLSQKAAALAYTTLVSLIPLLAAFSFLGARWFDEQQAKMVEVLSRVLPYSEEAIVVKIQEFLDHAQTIRGWGFAVFVLAALVVFNTIEQTINRIWNVPRARPLRSRLLSFTLLLFWGPVVVGAAQLGLLFLHRHALLDRGPLSVAAAFIPFTMTWFGLTMLYWTVPYTTVHFRSALAGGLVASLLLEGLRQGFGLYVDQVRNVSLIYGGFGLALLFMVSIQLAWWIVLLGNEATYCLQNFEFMARSRRDAAAFEGSWVALAALVYVTYSFRHGEPITPHEKLAERLQLETAELGRVLEPLIENGVLCETGGDSEGYLLRVDPHELPVGRVFEIYESLQPEILAPLPAPLTAELDKLRHRLDGARRRETEGLTLAQLASG